MTTRNPVKLLTECFAADISKSDWQHVRGSDLNWEAFIRFAEKERVLPALYRLLQRADVRSNIPTDLMGFLGSVEEMNGERNRAILAELGTVAKLLNEVGIEPVLLKGSAYLVKGVYANPARRYLGDLDLLVPAKSLQTGIQVLARHGFGWNSEDRLGHFRHHHPPIRRPGAVPVELHHSLGMGSCSVILPAQEVLSSSVRHEFLGAIVRIPSPEHLMVHLVMHSQLQHPYQERIWPPLRAMYDFTLVQRRFENSLDWNHVERRFREAGHAGLFALHVTYIRETLRASIPLAVPVTGMTCIRGLRRRLLRRVPLLRFLDPLYMFSTVLLRRLRLLRSALRVAGGWKEVAAELFKSGVYARLKSDILEGQGR